MIGLTQYPKIEAKEIGVFCNSCMNYIARQDITPDSLKIRCQHALTSLFLNDESRQNGR